MSDGRCFVKSESVVVRIPPGFKTDFATIPRGLRSFISVNGKHRLAALLHDYLYSVRGWEDRKKCDRIFLDEMKLAGVKYAKRYSMYWAVRAFGGGYWNAR